MSASLDSLNAREAYFWLGTEQGQLGVLRFRGMVVAVDGSDKRIAAFRGIDSRDLGFGYIAKPPV